MAASSIASYSSDHFQRLPMLQDARDDCLKAGGDMLIADVIKDFFKLVEYNGTSTPWSAGISGMREPQPSMWAFDDGGFLRPIEFHYTENLDTRWTEKELEFIIKLKSFLSQLGLDKKFGLARYPGDDFAGSCEITEGNANINLKPKDYPPALVHIPTIWYFSADLWQRGCRCTCNANAPDHPHGTHVYTMSG